MLNRLARSRNKVPVVETAGGSQEFIETLDDKIFQDIKYAINSDGLQELNIVESNFLQYYMDPSIAYYLNLSESIENYFEHKRINKLIDDLLHLSKQAESYENYRPYFECLKIIYQLMIRISQLHPYFDQVENTLKSVILCYIR